MCLGSNQRRGGTYNIGHAVEMLYVSKVDCVQEKAFYMLFICGHQLHCQHTLKEATVLWKFGDVLELPTNVRKKENIYHCLFQGIALKMFMVVLK